MMAETADMLGPLFDDCQGTATCVVSMTLPAGPSHDYFTVISPTYLTSYNVLIYFHKCSVFLLYKSIFLHTLIV